MAKKAGKAKSRKAAVRKSAPRKSAPRKATARKTAAPVEQTERSFPCKVLVKKGADQIPVEVKDAAHQARLVEQFGEANVEVLS